MDLSEIKNILVEQGGHFEAFKKRNDDRLADHDTKLNSIEQALAKMGRTNIGAGGTGGSDKYGHSVEQRKALDSMLRAFIGADPHGLKKHFDELLEAKAMSVGIDSDGGYFMSPPLQADLLRVMAEFSPFLNLATTVTLKTGDALEGIIDRDLAGASWVGEVTPRVDTSTPQVGKNRIELHELYALPKLTQKALDTIDFDLQQWLVSKVGEAFAVAEAAAFFSGTGVGQPRGFLTLPTSSAADTSRAWGSLQYVKSGTNGSLASADPLFDLVGALKPVYRPNARWIMPRAVGVMIRKLKDTTNQYLWQPGLQAGQPDMLLGYEIAYAEEMPALTTDSMSIAFGDFQQGYTILRKNGIRLLVDPYTDKPYVKQYVYERVGGAPTNTEAVKLMKFGTS